MEFNIYCDESCHMEHDDSNVMALGAVWLPKDSVAKVNQEIREIKRKYGVSPYAEIKWTKVSPSKLDMFIELVDYFFSNDDLHFRALIIPDKSILDHERYNQTHSIWYDKMYCDMLKKIFVAEHQYYVYPDIKDTHSYHRAKELRDYLSRKAHDPNKESILRVQPINSREVQIMQIVDVFTGAAVYANRDFDKGHICSRAKLYVVKTIEELSRESLRSTTKYRNQKFNILVWDPSRKGGIQ